MDKKRTKEFLELFQELQFTDVLAFGNILGVEEKEDFEEYVIEILEAFNLKERKVRKELLKLAKDVVKENRELISEKEAKALREKE